MRSSGSRRRPAAQVGGEQAPVLAPLVVLVTSGLLVLAQLYVAIPLAPVVGQALGGAGAPAALGTAYSIAYALGLLLFGTLSDRYGRKAILVPGMAALAVVTAVLVAAPSLAVVALLRGVQGLVAASFAASALPYVGEALPPRWRSPGIGALTTAFLVAGIVGQAYGQAVALVLGWRWVFGLAAPALALACVALARVLVEPAHDGQPVSLRRLYRALAALAVRRELALPYLATLTVLLSFVAMYAALGPLLRGHFGLASGGVLLVRLAGLPGMALAPLAGWLVGRSGAARVAVAGFVLAAAGLAAEAVAAAELWALVGASVVFVAGIATVVPSLIALIGSRAGANRGGALGLGGLALFAGASCGPLAAGLAVGFGGLLSALAVLLLVGGVLVAASEPARPGAGRPRGAAQAGERGP